MHFVSSTHFLSLAPLRVDFHVLGAWVLCCCQLPSICLLLQPTLTANPNKLCLCSLPESVAPGDLFTTFTSIFNDLLGHLPYTHIEIDRDYTALRPPKPDDPETYIHFYATKENILQKAWQRPTITYYSTQIHILHDLSGHTLAQRAVFKPLVKSEEFLFAGGSHSV